MNSPHSNIFENRFQTFNSISLILMRFFHLFILMICCGSLMQAQSYSIEGKVVDARTGFKLSQCRVELMSLVDTTYLNTQTTLYGNFQFYDIQNPGKYLLVVSQVGYARFAKTILIQDRYQKLEPIRMVDSTYMLKETTIKNKKNALIQKGDTLEMNAKQYRTTPDMDAIYFLNKIPGIQMDGNITVQGDSVSKVQINGMLCYGDNPRLLLQSLPASIIEKIQVFDDIPEGKLRDSTKKNNQPKVMNIVTSKDYFSKPRTKLSGGYATGNLFFADANIVSQRKEEMITLNGTINKGRIKTGDYFDASSQFQSSGLPLDQDISFSLQKKINSKLNIQTNFNWSRYGNTIENESISRYTDGENSGGIIQSDNQQHNVSGGPGGNIKIEFEPDSFKKLTWRVDYRRNRNERNFDQHALNTLGSIDLKSLLKSHSLSTSRNISSYLNYSLRDRKEKFSGSASLRFNNNSNDQVSETYAENIRTDTLIQNYQNQYLSAQNYIEPDFSIKYDFSKKHSLESGINFWLRQSQTSQDVNNFNTTEQAFNLVDSSLLIRIQQESQEIKWNLNYYYNHEKLNINVYSSISKFKLQSGDFNLNRIDQSFVLPSLNLSIYIPLNKNENLNIQLAQRNETPSFSELNPTLNNVNRLSMQIGNPDLIPTQVLRSSIRYKWKNAKTGSFFHASLNGNYFIHPIRQNTLIASSDTLFYQQIVIEPGAQIRYYENNKNYYSLNAQISYDFPFKYLRSILKPRIDYTQYQRYSEINYVQNKAFSQSISPSLTLSSNLSSHIDFIIFAKYRYERIQQNLPFSAQEIILNAFLNIELVKNTFFKIESNNNQLSGTGKSQKSRFHILDLSVSRSFFNKTPLTLTFLAHDIFNSYRNYDFRNFVNYTTEEYNTGVRRYFLFKAAVRF